MHRLLDAGTKFDLKWLAALDVPGMQPTIPGADSDVTRLDLSELIDHWQAGGASWRRRVKRAWRKFLSQESMMYDLRLLHKDFFRTLQEHDATFSFSPFHAAHTSGLDHNVGVGVPLPQLRVWHATRESNTRNLLQSMHTSKALFALSV